MGKTVKQIADEIGVSKTAVRKYMDDNFKKQYTTQEGERSPIIVSEEGEAILKQKCKGLSPANRFVETPETTEKQAIQTANQVNTELLNILQEELKTLREQLSEKDSQITQKDAQIAEKDEQIKSLTETNKNLSAANVNLTDSLKASQALNAADKKLLLEATSRRSLWSRIFGRKKQPANEPQPEATEVS